MTTRPFTEVRTRLSELLDQVEQTHERIEITRQGRVAAVILSPDDLGAIEDSLAVLASPELTAQLVDSNRQVAAGEVLDADALAEQLQAKTRPEATGRGRR
jgi:antitoxin YefM